MEYSISTIFLSMALTVALMRFIGLQDPPVEVWGIFFFFIVNKIRFYIGDIRYARIAPIIVRDDSHTDQIIALLLGIGVLFIFILMGYYVIDPSKFYLWYSLGLIINIGWLWYLRNMIDPQKDTYKKRLVRDVIKSWIILDFYELPITFTTGVLLFAKPEIGNIKFEQMELWVIYTSIGILVFIAFMELIINKIFLFDRYYILATQSE